MRLTAKERILLHLLDFVKYSESVEVPSEMAQEGIADRAGIDLRHVAQYVRPLVSEELVRERIAHVEEFRQRRKVYDLTESGRLAGIRLRERLKTETVHVRDAEGTREATIAQAVQYSKGSLSFLTVARQAAEHGLVDLSLVPPVQGRAFVEMLADAPKLGKFVGRQDELKAIVREEGRSRIVVVRGVAGIGKTSLAAKACELQRGKRNLYWHRVRAWDNLASMLGSLGDFLRALGKPGIHAVLERGEPHRAGQILREDLGGTRGLLVYDDAHEGSAEVIGFFKLLKESVEETRGVTLLFLTRESLGFYDGRDIRLSGLIEELDLSGLEPGEVAAWFAAGPDAEARSDLGNRVGGHPLFLLLLQATEYATPGKGVLRDFNRFMEDQVYATMSDASRRVMKLACLYQVPVSRDAMLEGLGEPHEVFLEASNRFLIRPVGDDRFEVHDSIRDFFAGLLTPSERRTLAGIASAHLRRLASDSLGTGAAIASLNYLSNALALAESPEEREGIWETLGDAYGRIGDLPAALTAYREALRLPTDPETIARLHRRMAEHLQYRRDLSGTGTEIEAGFQALGPLVNAERGWLELLRARQARFTGRPEEALEHAAVALQILRATGDVRGQSAALVELGTQEMFQDHVPAAEAYVEEGVRVARMVKDSELLEDALSILAWVVGWGRGDAERALICFAEIEALPTAAESIRIQADLHGLRGAFRLLIQADFVGAEEDTLKCADLCRRAYDIDGYLKSQGFLAEVRYYQGRIGEARRLFEEEIAQRRRLGHSREAVIVMNFLAHCFLLEEDREGFRRVVAEFQSPDLAAGVEDQGAIVKTLQALDDLIAGAGDVALRKIEDASRNPPMPQGLYVHLYAAAGLRALGDEVGAEGEHRQWRKWAESHSRKAFLATMPERERHMTEVLKKWIPPSSTS